MIFKHYRARLAVVRRRQELVTEREADGWFGVTPDAVKAARTAMEKQRAEKVVKLEKEKAAA